MSDSHPRPPAGPDPEDRPGTAADPEPEVEGRMAGFFDETVREPESEPDSDDGDFVILRNMTDEFAAAQADDEGRRREQEAERQRLAEERAKEEAERRAAEAKAAEEAAAREREEEAQRQREERAAAMFIEPDLSPTPPPTPDQELAAAAAAATKARRAKPRKRRRHGPHAPLPSTVALGVAGVVLAGATVLAVARFQPFHTWYYVFAWYPFLMAINHLTAMRSPEHSVFSGRGRTVAAMLAWSVPLWLVFEAFNFRLENWYYIGVPRELPWRRLGVVVSFATVLPGVLLLEELLRVRGAFGKLRTPAFAWRDPWDRIVLGVGVAWTVLVLALPQYFYPLVWGVPVLLLEPWLRRGGGPSLIRDLSEGSPGRALRLLAAGMACGLWWEAANTIAGGKWIYTVPGLDALRPFEMPLFGFIGFAPFALCLWTMARALVRLGLLPDWERAAAPREPAAEAEGAEDAVAVESAAAESVDATGDESNEATPQAAPPPARRPRPRFLRTRRAAIALAAVFSLVVLALMDRWTIDSFTSSAADVPGVPDGIPEYAREHGKDSVPGLLQLIRTGALYVPGESNARMLERLEDACRLSLLHGIGTDNARRLLEAGIGSVEELAAADASEVTGALGRIDERGWHPRPRRVAEWIRAARKEAPRSAP